MSRDDPEPFLEPFGRHLNGLSGTCQLLGPLLAVPALQGYEPFQTMTRDMIHQLEATRVAMRLEFCDFLCKRHAQSNLAWPVQNPTSRRQLTADSQVGHCFALLKPIVL